VKRLERRIVELEREVAPLFQQRLECPKWDKAALVERLELAFAWSMWEQWGIDLGGVRDFDFPKAEVETFQKFYRDPYEVVFEQWNLALGGYDHWGFLRNLQAEFGDYLVHHRGHLFRFGELDANDLESVRMGRILKRPVGYGVETKEPCLLCRGLASDEESQLSLAELSRRMEAKRLLSSR